MDNVPLWDDGRWTPLPRLVGEVAADVCVVGLGGSGLACVDELLSLGLDVVGLEASSVAGGASGRNAGFLRAGLASFHHEAVRRFGRDRAVRLYRLTAAERERMLHEAPEHVRRTGYLRLAHDAEEERDCRAHHAALRADDLPCTWYDGSLGRGVLVPDDAVCNPLARCRWQALALAGRGARLFEDSAAVQITSDQVESAAGRVSCRSVVVAVDGGLAAALPEFRGRARSARLQMLATAPAPDVTFPAAIGARRGWDYWQQTPDHRVALGGCRDVGGTEEWTTVAWPSERVQQALERLLRERLGVRAPVTHRWAATVSYTDDGLPHLAEVRPGVWAVGAYSGTGNLLGAALGRAAARLASGHTRESPLD
jgi:glycine/D-amino acid oxidase-like deaminating enzyme